MIFGCSASRFLSTTTGWLVQSLRPLNDEGPRSRPNCRTRLPQPSPKMAQTASVECLFGERGAPPRQPGRCDRGCCRIHHASRNRRREDRQEPLMSSDPSRLIAALAHDRINLDLKTLDLCFPAGRSGVVCVFRRGCAHRHVQADMRLGRSGRGATAQAGFVDRRKRF